MVVSSQTKPVDFGCDCESAGKKADYCPHLSLLFVITQPMKADHNFTVSWRVKG